MLKMLRGIRNPDAGHGRDAIGLFCHARFRSRGLALAAEGFCSARLRRNVSIRLITRGAAESLLIRR
jgi:hypothetical protein